MSGFIPFNEVVIMFHYNAKGLVLKNYFFGTEGPLLDHRPFIDFRILVLRVSYFIWAVY